MKGNESKSSTAPAKPAVAIDVQKEQNYTLDIIVVRIIFAVSLTLAAYIIEPFGLSGRATIPLGLGCALAIIYFEHRLKRATLKRLIGAAIGSLMAIIGATLISLILKGTEFDKNSISFINIFVLFLMTYVGLVVGANKGDYLNLSALGGIFGGERPVKKIYKILDTSVIIDGRIADICETGFLDGILVIPHFVLRELQQVADSADALKRNRGRRGLDILQKIQKMAGITVQFVENDYPAVREVDMKLIELAMEFEAKIVTNDFNLSKVAQLGGVDVVNLNELAASLKAVVLPGEKLTIRITRTGEEPGQGVGYLEDGTMVVVENGRAHIGEEVEVIVTQVIQTERGKMIFGEVPPDEGPDAQLARAKRPRPKP
jgi:uncharacterized protein YacL